jgi:plastocyanin
MSWARCIAGALVISLLAITGCGGGDDEGAAAGGQGASEQAPGAAAEGSGGEAGEGGGQNAAGEGPVDEPSPVTATQDGRAATEVTIADFRFTPPEATIAAGEAVSFTNTDDFAHTVTSGTRAAPTGDFDEKLSKVGSSTLLTFSEPGAYPYFCRIHLDMDGRVIVE